MEKQNKPVPNVECLKYHGTPSKPDIKIFVSHRIDLDSATIDNPLYIPVRCGAVYDEREDVTMLGDDTGDNISEKRGSFCEFTVMYWAWKNIKADYYGLCHYRRYLSFLEEDLPGASLKQGLLDSMSKSTLKRCGLLDEENIRSQILEADAIVPYEYEDVIPDKTCKNIKDNWIKYHRSYLQPEDYDKMLGLIKKKFPEYYNTAKEYVNGKKFMGFNCFVMKRELFFKMCEFMFPILFAFQSEVKQDNFSSTQKRETAYLGEWLFSIFIEHQKKNNNIQEHQILAFQNTDKTESIYPAFSENNIAVVVPAMDYNRPQIGVQLQAIIQNSSKKFNYDFIIIRRSYDEDKFGTAQKKELDKILQQMVKDLPNISVRFYDPREELLDIEVRKFGEPSKEEFYYLPAIPYILKNYKRAVYLQQGMISCTDIAELFNMELDNKFAAAPKDIFFSASLNGYQSKFKEYAGKKLRMRNLYNYVSTNIVLLDLEKIRNNYAFRNFVNIVKERKLGNIAGDSLNVLLEDKIKFLSQAWNKIGCWGWEYFRFLEYVPEELANEQKSEECYFCNIYALGSRLPQETQIMKLFWHYARQTPFYESLFSSIINSRILPPPPHAAATTTASSSSSEKREQKRCSSDEKAEFKMAANTKENFKIMKKEKLNLGKQNKPVPNVECLKYHGTPSKPDIKIFVSHRIDLDSETIDNPLYIPVRCGAVFDERPDITILGDDTGDNISEKRLDFCEYTVMYWAWKNIKADYYGLCHYRRFLEFADEEFEEWDEHRFYYEPYLNNKSAAKYGLLNSKLMAVNITKYDLTTSITYEAENVPIFPRRKTVRELFLNHPALLTSEAMIDKVTELVKKDYPQYAESFCEELESSVHRGFNCFIMKKELFNKMAEYLFDVLFKLEAILKNGEIPQSNARELGYVGEIIYGSFIRWLMKQEKYSVNERHIVLFADTSKAKTVIKASFYSKIKNLMQKILPAYRTSLRVEQRLLLQQQLISEQQHQMSELSRKLSSIQLEISRLIRFNTNTFWTQQHSFSNDTDENKLAFWRGYPKATGDLLIIQKAQAALLHRVKKFCNDLKISFWLHGGSLIGGLRHQGLVPWDDDIDIAMLREDFDRLVKSLKDNETYAINNFYYISLGCRSYRFVRKDLDSHCFVDIFVYDHYSPLSDDLDIDWKNLKHKKHHLILKLKEISKERKEFPKNDARLTEFPELKKNFDEIIDTYIMRTKSLNKDTNYLVWGIDNNYEGPAAFAWNHGRIFEYKDIFPLRECVFEGKTYKIPNNYEKYAFAEYGVRYVEMPKNMGESIHFNQYFADEDQIKFAKELIEKEMETDE